MFSKQAQISIYSEFLRFLGSQLVALLINVCRAGDPLSKTNTNWFMEYQINPSLK